MEAPKCKLCGERHYGLCKQPEREAVKAVTKAMEGIKLRFDRTAYQRELMRTRRAADKEAKRLAKEHEK